MPRSVPEPAGGFRHIAVIRLSSLGDVVLTLPLVRSLDAAFPAARISYWVKEEFAGLVAHDPAVDHVRALDREARRLEDLVSMSTELEDADLIVDLHGSLRSRVLTFRQKAPVLHAASYRVLRERWVRARWTGPEPVPHALERYATALAPIGVTVSGVPRVEAGAEAEAWAEGFFAEWGLEAQPVALCPGARHFTKRWPEEHGLGLDERLAREGRPRLYFSLESERRVLGALAQRVASDARARWCVEPLPRMAALLSCCAGAVSGDSGLMHLAAARGLRVVALFGSTVPELGFAPSGEGHAVLQRALPCRPCTVHGRESCPLEHFKCLREITPEQVAGALAGL